MLNPIQKNTPAGLNIPPERSVQKIDCAPYICYRCTVQNSDPVYNANPYLVSVESSDTYWGLLTHITERELKAALKAAFK